MDDNIDALDRPMSSRQAAATASASASAAVELRQTLRHLSRGDGVPTTPTTLKRKGAVPELSPDSPLHPKKRSSLRAEINVTFLETKVLRLENQCASKDETIELKRAENEKLSQEKRKLNELHDKALADVGKVRREAEQVKEDGRKRESESQRKIQQLEDKLSSLSSEHTTLSRTHQLHVARATSDQALNNDRIRRLEEERDNLQTYRDQAHRLSEENQRLGSLLTEARRAASGPVAHENGSRAHPSSSGGTDPEAADLRKELRTQAGMLSTLQKTNSTLQKEIAELRLRRDNVELLRSQMKEMERNARDNLRIVRDELAQVKREYDSMTMHPSASASADLTMSDDKIVLQHRLAELSDAHSNCGSTITALRTQVSETMNKLETTSNEASLIILDLQKKGEAAERELRWLGDAKVNAERKLALARQDLDILRHKSSVPSTSSGTDPGTRVAELEQQLEIYQQAIEGFETDKSDHQAKVILELDLVKRSDLETANARATRLEKDIVDLRDSIGVLKADNDELMAACKDFEDRVGSGEYNTKVWRVIEMQGGPAARDQAIRKETLDALQQENQALLEQIMELESMAGAGGNGDDQQTGSHVPKETLSRHQKELAEQKAAADKRLQRLKEVFGAKTLEFLQGVYSLTGWQFKWSEAGGEVKLTNIYAPKGKMGLTIKVKSGDNNFADFVMTGGMARQFTHLRDYWVVERQSMAGFLASVTLEMFEKTTIGRAAGYMAYEDRESEEQGL